VFQEYKVAKYESGYPERTKPKFPRSPQKACDVPAISVGQFSIDIIPIVVMLPYTENPTKNKKTLAIAHCSDTLIM